MFLSFSSAGCHLIIFLNYSRNSCSSHSSSSHFSRLWPHHSSVRLWQGLLHHLRPVRSSLHHAGAHCLRPEAHVSPGHRSSRPPATHRDEAPVSHCCPLRVAADPGGAVLLHGSSSGVHCVGGVLVILRWRLLLFHLPLHHRTWWLCSRHTAWTEVQAAVPALSHG